MIDKKRITIPMGSPLKGVPQGMTLKGLNLVIIVLIIALMSLILIVQATTQEELESEKIQIEQELTDANYSWLIDYSGDIKIHNIMY